MTTAPTVEKSPLELPAESLASAAFALALSCAGGGTLWCVAPRWPAHGRHVAVEFVHPVVVGTRALPAVHLEHAAPADALRLLARPGDVLLVIGPPGEPIGADLLRRAEAWDLTRLWIGAGERPAPGSAEHVIWLEGIEPEVAARSGDVVLCYHLLWELTQVVFEHPGLLRPAPVCEGEVCITCSDEGRVAEVRRLIGDASAEVLAGGRVEEVDVSLVRPLQTGDLLLCHAGVALSVLEEWQR
jgi:hydrogenase maturation factor